jgi:hypothetical protein
VLAGARAREGASPQGLRGESGRRRSAGPSPGDRIESVRFDEGSSLRAAVFPKRAARRRLQPFTARDAPDGRNLRRSRRAGLRHPPCDHATAIGPYADDAPRRRWKRTDPDGPARPHRAAAQVRARPPPCRVVEQQYGADAWGADKSGAIPAFRREGGLQATRPAAPCLRPAGRRA